MLHGFPLSLTGRFHLEACLDKLDSHCSARGILGHKSHRKLAPAHGRAGNLACNLWTWFLKGWRHQPRPAPTAAPQFVIRMTILTVLHQHEPTPQSLGMADSARGRHSGSRLKFDADWR